MTEQMQTDKWWWEANDTKELEQPWRNINIEIEK